MDKISTATYCNYIKNARGCNKNNHVVNKYYENIAVSNKDDDSDTDMNSITNSSAISSIKTAIVGTARREVWHCTAAASAEASDQP